MIAFAQAVIVIPIEHKALTRAREIPTPWSWVFRAMSLSLISGIYYNNTKWAHTVTRHIHFSASCSDKWIPLSIFSYVGLPENILSLIFQILGNKILHLSILWFTFGGGTHATAVPLGKSLDKIREFNPSTIWIKDQSGNHAWQQAPLPTDPSCWPKADS